MYNERLGVSPGALLWQARQCKSSWSSRIYVVYGGVIHRVQDNPKIVLGWEGSLEHVNDMLVNASVHEHHEKYVVLYWIPQT